MSCSSCAGNSISPGTSTNINQDISGYRYDKYRDYFVDYDVFGGGTPTACNACRYHPSTLKDYFTLEGTTDPGTISLRRSIDVKRVRLDNDTPYDLAIAIIPYRYTPQGAPQPQFVLNAGSTRFLGVNQPGDNLQFIHVYDHETGNLINTPHPIDYHNNQFVIRGGNYQYGREGPKRYCMNTNEFDPNHGKPTEKWVWITDYRQPSI